MTPYTIILGQLRSNLYAEPRVEQQALMFEESMRRLTESAQAVFAAEDKFLGILQREGLLK